MDRRKSHNGEMMAFIFSGSYEKTTGAICHISNKEKLVTMKPRKLVTMKPRKGQAGDHWQKVWFKCTILINVGLVDNAFGADQSDTFISTDWLTSKYVVRLLHEWKRFGINNNAGKLSTIIEYSLRVKKLCWIHTSVVPLGLPVQTEVLRISSLYLKAGIETMTE